MKKLTRMRLINWHRFVDATVDFGLSTLVTGENGAGKTTLLDAIQFVLLCSANTFNVAAHEKGSRKLDGYVRCRTGKENQPYERGGEISAHVALEFYEESREQYFILGAVVDSPSPGQETSVRYLIDRCRLEEVAFFAGDAPRSILQFHAANTKELRQWCKTQAEARKMVKQRLGRLDDKFFRLIPKALAFRPIDDIKDFVYSYVLDEKEVRIDVLKENVRTYQELEEILAGVRRRMSALEEIETYHAEVIACQKNGKKYEYFIARAEADLAGQRARELAEALRQDGYRREQAERELEHLNRQKDRQQELVLNLRQEMKQNKEYVALEERRKLLAQLEEEEGRQRRRLKGLKQHVSASLKHVNALLLKRELLEGEETRTGGSGDQTDTGVTRAIGTGGRELLAPLRLYREQFSHLEKIEDTAAARELVDQVISCKGELYASVSRAILERELLLNQQERQAHALRDKITNLEKQKLSYEPAVERLKGAVIKKLGELGREGGVYVLCELLEIRDERWRNAVEGYLNTQRFYILVEPENYDAALAVYDRLRREHKAYGVGLINAQRLDEYDEAPEGSLAQMVTSSNRHAARYINMVLGRVHCCGRLEDLKRYPTAITKECMRYHNHVASAIRPEIYEVPYIGSHAFRVQLEQARQKERSLTAQMDTLRGRLGQLRALQPMLAQGEEYEVKSSLDVLGELKSLRAELEGCRASVKELEESRTLIEKQAQLQLMEGELKDLERQADDLKMRIGGLNNAIETKRAEEAALREQVAGKEREALEKLAEGDTGQEGWTRDYAKQTAGKSFQQIRENYEQARKSGLTREGKATENMKEAMRVYKTENHFGAPADLEGYPEFAAEYVRLKTSDLLKYEERVRSAKEAAETEFREQFLSKMQENMKQAQEEFKQLNRALKDITFSNDRYEFLYMPSRRNRSYYDMFMDDFNATSGISLFSGLFQETHREVIEELFDRLTAGGEDNEKVLKEYTDYRTYMDYDIRILHGDGSYSLYSKVCEEKSGGETQTPFYVTVAASFVQLYKNSISNEAAALVLFDEAFNNMDDERIGGVLEFLRRLPLQLVISAPPGKIEYISPQMTETLLVFTDGRVNYVEEIRVDEAM